MSKMIPSIRRALDNNSILQNLGLLTDFAGTWHGTGFNLVARPFFGLPDNKPPIPANNLFLELNLTDEMLQVVPISSSIPNRGTFQEDLELFGLTYLQKISDATTGGALHIEPGIWVTHGPTTDPVENPPADGQIVARMGSIPHGNALLAGGFAKKFKGPPTLGAPTTAGIPAFSIFPSFNTTPIVVAAAPPPLINAAGASEFLTVAGGGFSQYTLTQAILELHFSTTRLRPQSFRPPSRRSFSMTQSRSYKTPFNSRLKKVAHLREWRSTSPLTRRSALSTIRRPCSRRQDRLLLRAQQHWLT